MKKILMIAILATFSVSAFASSATTETHFTAIQNSETTDAFALNTISNRTEYRNESVRSICYRQVFDGYRTICDRLVGLTDRDGDHDHGRDGDHGGGRGGYEPRPIPVPVCYSQPVYRTEAYSCWETVSVPYEVFDHNSTANVNLKISPTPETRPVVNNCGVSFNLTGDLLVPTNTCAQYVAVANKSVENHGYINNYNYAIKLLDAETILAPLAGNLQGLQVNGNELVVKTGTLTGASNFSIKLYVQRRRLFKSDVVLIDRALNSGEYSYQATDAKTGLVHINLQKLLGNFEASKKNVIRVSLDVNIDSPATIVNQAMPALHQEASITINK